MIKKRLLLLGLNILLATMLAPLTGTAQAGSMTWVIYDVCPGRESIRLRFFDIDNGLIWPEANNFYYTKRYGEGYKASLECIKGARICYGAWQPEARKYWGGGENGAESCADCCALCDGDTYEKRLSCSGSFFPNSAKLEGQSQKAVAVPQNRRTPDFEEITIQDIEPVFRGYITSWNNKDYNKQMSYLSEDFNYVDQDNKDNYDEYLAKKKRLFEKYEWISVKTSAISYGFDRNIGTVTYYQHYNSPHYESKGTNTFYFRKSNGQTKIFKEEFKRDNYKIK